jgi:hypothetical protein
MEMIHHIPSNGLIGAVFGFIGGLVKTIMIFETSVFSPQAIIETFFTGAVAAAGGLLLAGTVKWLQKKWLGRTKKK